GWRRGGGAAVWFVSPLGGRGGRRPVTDRSRVLGVSAGSRSVLLPGDAGAAAEEELPPLESTVVKVPHHGSRSASTPRLVSTSRAWLALFSDGRANRFGLPAPEVVERWRASGAEVLRPDVGGALGVERDEPGVRWEACRGRAGRLAVRPLAAAAGSGHGSVDDSRGPGSRRTEP